MPLTFSSVLEEIENSEEFANFKQKNPDAELCAGFFVLDKENQSTQQHIDYSLPSGKIYTFILANEITLKEAETLDEAQGNEVRKLELINRNINVDLDDVEKILDSEFENNKIKQKINKIIAILQKHNGQQFWNLTCMLESMGIIQVKIDSSSGEIIKFEKKSLFDIIKKS